MLATTLPIVLANGNRGSSYALGNGRSVQLSYLLHQGPLLHVLVSGLLVLIQEGLPRRVRPPPSDARPPPNPQRIVLRVVLTQVPQLVHVLNRSKSNGAEVALQKEQWAKHVRQYNRPGGGRDELGGKTTTSWVGAMQRRA